MSEIDLVRELIAREIADMESRLNARLDALAAGLATYEIAIAELRVAVAPPEPVEEIEPEAVEEVAEESAEEAIEETTEEIEGDGVPAEPEDLGLEDVPDSVLEQVEELHNEVAEEMGEEIRPERHHWLGTPIRFRRG